MRSAIVIILAILSTAGAILFGLAY